MKRARPEMRKPTLAGAGFLNASDFTNSNDQDLNETKTQRQACRIRDRFAVSLSTARVIAELAYGGGA